MQKVGPGTYNIQGPKKELGAIVDYDKNLKKTEARERNTTAYDRDIGPGDYDINERLIMPKIPGFKIVPESEKELTIEKALAEIDRRDFLDINYEPTKKHTEGGIINPEHQEKRFNIEEVKNVKIQNFDFLGSRSLRARLPACREEDRHPGSQDG